MTAKKQVAGMVEVIKLEQGEHVVGCDWPWVCGSEVLEIYSVLVGSTEFYLWINKFVSTCISVMDPGVCHVCHMGDLLQPAMHLQVLQPVAVLVRRKCLPSERECTTVSA